MIGLLELRVGLSITSVMLGYIKGSWMQVREVHVPYPVDSYNGDS